MDAFALEVFLDMLGGRLATALPAHLAACASAYVSNRPPPPSPTVAPKNAVRLFEGTLSKDAGLAVRAVSLLRVIAPTVIDADPRVTAAYVATPSWDAWRALCAARDEVARSLFGLPHRDLLHRLAGCRSSSQLTVTVPAKIDAWHAVGRPVSEQDVRAVWARLATGVSVGALEIATSDAAHPRMFAIERGVRATIVIPARIDAPAKMFTVLHELGHALLWLSSAATDREWPRMIDEAAAAYVAREMEDPVSAWFDENAEAARQRRTLLAAHLAAIEANPALGTDAVAAKPPWALWHDPAMQGVYVAAELLADELPARMTGAELVANLAARARTLDENRPLRR
ncbi:MAG TPA: hypothetical protein VGM90_28455 [Kofleriaceae bacterium]